MRSRYRLKALYNKHVIWILPYYAELCVTPSNRILSLGRLPIPPLSHPWLDDEALARWSHRTPTGTAVAPADRAGLAAIRSSQHESTGSHDALATASQRPLRLQVR